MLFTGGVAHSETAFRHSAVGRERSRRSGRSPNNIRPPGQLSPGATSSLGRSDQGLTRGVIRFSTDTPTKNSSELFPFPYVLVD